MRRIVEFYSEELNRKVRMPIVIKIKRVKSRMMLEVEIPQQKISLTEESTYSTATWNEV